QVQEELDAVVPGTPKVPTPPTASDRGQRKSAREGPKRRGRRDPTAPLFSAGSNPGLDLLPFRHFVPIRTAANLDLAATRPLALGDHDAKDAILEGGFDVVLLDIARQHERAAELAVTALREVPAMLLVALLPVLTLLTADGEDVVLQP